MYGKTLHVLYVQYMRNTCEISPQKYLTIVLTEPLVAVLEVSKRKDFENDRRQRQEQK